MPQRFYTPPTFVALGVSCALIVFGMARLRRRPAADEDRLSESRLAPLLMLAGAAAAAALMVAAWSFAFLHDDFAYLVSAATDPWGFDSQLRLIGVQVPFWAAVHSGLPAVAFVVMNTAGVVLCAVALAAALTGARWRRGEALLAALLFVASDPVIRLAIWGAGLQQLLAWCLYFAVLWAVRRSAIEADTREGNGWALLALGLGGLSGFCKWQVAWICVPSGWLWAADPGLSPAGRRRRWLVPLGVAALIAVPLLAEGIAGASGNAGIGRLATNLREALQRLLWLVAAAFVGLTAAAAVARGSGQGVPAWLRERLVAHWPTTRRALAMAALAIVPFLFNERYFAEYYVGPATAWIAAAGAPLLADVVPPGQRRWGVAAIIVLLWMPTNTLLGVASAASPGHRVAAWLDELREPLLDHPPPPAIAIDAACASADSTRESRARLEDLFGLSEQGLGVRWATGWLHVPVVLGPGAPGALRLAYCAETLPHVRLAAGTSEPATATAHEALLMDALSPRHDAAEASCGGVTARYRDSEGAPAGSRPPASG